MSPKIKIITNITVFTARFKETKKLAKTAIKARMIDPKKIDI